MLHHHNIFTLSLQDTSVIKGIAIVAMICHHVFQYPSHGVEYTGVLYAIGVLGKVCVALFLFCSGYGLTVQYQKRVCESSTGWWDNVINSIRFVLNRLAKFYASYWPVFVVFVPITIFCFDRSLVDAYGENMNVVKRLVYDFMGLQGWKSYNTTWWFNKLIIILYLVFPLMYHIIRKLPWTALVISCLLMWNYNRIHWVSFSDILIYQFPFVLGILWNMKEDAMNMVSEWVKRYKYIALLILLTMVGVCIVHRLYGVIPSLVTETQFDGFFALCIVLSILYMIRVFPNKYMLKAISFVGVHSVNMYLVHTFLQVYWGGVSKILYSKWLGAEFGVNAVVLILLSLLLSMAIEWVKKVIGWNALVEKMIQLLRIKI